MIIDKVGSRGTYFSYEDGDGPLGLGTSVYLINSENRIFLIDTHTGSKSMEPVIKYIKEQGLQHKEVVVFNSHADWDHIWGNHVFKDSVIIAHETGRRRMIESGEFDIEKLKKYHNGQVEIKLPNLTFGSKLTFAEDDIEFIYAPGHTEDSALCFDRKDRVLFVGDLIESPIPYICYHDVDKYIQTLEVIKNFDTEIVISAHSGVVDRRLIDENISYIRDVLLNKPLSLKYYPVRNVHEYNVRSKMLSKYEDIIRGILGSRFNYRTYKQEFWSIVNSEYQDMAQEFYYIINTSIEELEKSMQQYISTLTLTV